MWLGSKGHITRRWPLSSEGADEVRLSEVGEDPLLQMDLRVCGQSGTASYCLGLRSELCQPTRCMTDGDSRQALHRGILESSRQQQGRYRCDELGMVEWLE